MLLGVAWPVCESESENVYARERERERERGERERLREREREREISKHSTILQYTHYLIPVPVRAGLDYNTYNIYDLCQLSPQCLHYLKPVPALAG